MEATAALEPRTTTHIIAWPLRMTVVLAFAGVLFFARLGERALWSEEIRWLQIPREMQASGDWLWPTINGQTYYDKPLGSYWLVLLSRLATGSLDEESARLPSAVSGLLGVALMMLIARRLHTDAVALWAGLILATSFSFVFFARHASADVETVTGLLAALWLFLKHEERPSGGWIIALWLVMALTSLTKGLLGFVLPILIIGTYSLAMAFKCRHGEGPAEPVLTGNVEIAHGSDSAGASPSRASLFRPLIRLLFDANGWLLQRATLAAIPLAAACYLTPFLLSLATHGSGDGFAMVYRENIRRFFDPVNHRGPIYLYSYVIFMLLAPWSLLLPAALVHAHFGADRQSKGRLFALAYFWGTFVFYTLSASRRSYYLLPILPAAALLIAQMLTERQKLRPLSIWLLRVGFAILTAATALSLASLFPVVAWLPAPSNQLPELPSPGYFLVAWLFSLAGIGVAWVRLDVRRIGWAFAVAASSMMLYLFLGALPAVEIYRTQKPFADAVKRVIGSTPSGLALYGTREIVGNLDPSAPIAELHSQKELEDAIQAQMVRWLVIRRRDWEQLNRRGTIVVAETIHSWEERQQTQSKLLLIDFKADGP
jgi:4-amino-4-deoxy-L-arabinose transferase-like glycosyltransferase